MVMWLTAKKWIKRKVIYLCFVKGIKRRDRMLAAFVEALLRFVCLRVIGSLAGCY